MSDTTFYRPSKWGKSVSERSSDPALPALLHAWRVCVRGVRKMIAADLGVGVDRMDRMCAPPEDDGEPSYLEMLCRVVDRAIREKGADSEEALAPVRYLVDRYLVRRASGAAGAGVVQAAADVLTGAGTLVDVGIEALRDGTVTADELPGIRDARGRLERSIHILDRELEIATHPRAVRVPVLGEVR